MNKKYRKVMIACLILGLFFWVFGRRARGADRKSVEWISPENATIENAIRTTGTVKPQNRLQIIPPLAGRMEDILVQEGTLVKKGQILAVMSSTERAALLDAAQGQGQEEQDYWKKVYRPTTLTAPIDGQVIARKVEPGQTIGSSQAVLVLSDRLIIKAQVDESDLGYVAVGQSANIVLDAYPADSMAATVDHISYESEVVNNVTIYEVDVVPVAVPAYYRSGMSADVIIVQEQKKDVLSIPVEALGQDNEGDFVIRKNTVGSQRVPVEAGLADDVRVEIISGLKAGDKISARIQADDNEGHLKEVKNPFVPWSYKKRKK